MDIPRKKWQKELFEIYDRVRKESEPYISKQGKLDLVVLPNVFSPKYFTDSYLFAVKLGKIVKNKSLLEIGSGTGIISVICALKGAKVVATDINKNAVKNTKLNFKKFKLKGSIRIGDVYGPIKKNEKFDVIFWNHPFNNWKTPIKDVLLKAGLDYKYKSLNKYISQARKHLKSQGKLLIGTGNYADLKEMKKIASRNFYKLKLLDEINLPIEKGASNKLKNKFFIYEFINI
jgi:release factor glutamine methyltransferase